MGLITIDDEAAEDLARWLDRHDQRFPERKAKMTTLYDHTIQVEVTVRNEAPYLSALTAAETFEAFEYALDKLGFKRTKVKPIGYGRWSSQVAYPPNEQITNDRLKEYHALAAAVLGRGNDKARHLHRDLVLGKRVIASAMTNAQFDLVMKSLREARD